MKWTSRERIVAAINHREPDRVPVDVTPLYDFYLNLKKFLSIEIDEEVKHNLFMEVIPHPEILRKLGADIISSLPCNRQRSILVNTPLNHLNI